MPEEQVSPLAQIWTRSLDDADFRARLLADPRSTLEDEMGLMLPENMQVNVVENTRHEYTIVLPVAADAAGDEDAQRRGTTQLMYHIPEHSFASDLHLDQVQGVRRVRLRGEPAPTHDRVAPSRPTPTRGDG